MELKAQDEEPKVRIDPICMPRALLDIQEEAWVPIEGDADHRLISQGRNPITL
jgi:hypothetical protein